MNHQSPKRTYTVPATTAFFVESECVLASSTKVSFSGTFGDKGFSTYDLDVQSNPAPSASAVFKGHSNANAL